MATEQATQSDAESLLASQRLKRPVSPHLTIYDPKQIWFGSSIWQRFTGMGLSGLLYGYAGVYLIAPLVGWHLESASLAAAIATWPLVAKGGLKFFLAWPFVFHAFNGVRHLTYDLALGYSKKDIKNWGYALWGASLVSGLAVAFLL